MSTNGKLPQATMPKPQQQQRSAAQPAPSMVEHPAVQSYVAEWHRMAHELDTYKRENTQLRYDLDCSRQMISELQHISDHERSKKESYQRWATKFDTMAGEIAALATHLRDEAARAAQPEAPMPQIEDQALPEPAVPVEKLNEIDDGIAAFAKKFAPQSKSAL